MASGKRPRIPLDQYYTPPPQALQLVGGVLETAASRGLVLGEFLEPCAGRGALIDALLARGIRPSQITAVEVHPVVGHELKLSYPQVRVVVGDFLSYSHGDKRGVAIVCNPPFGRYVIEPFLRHVFRQGAEIVGIILPSQWRLGKRIGSLPAALVRVIPLGVVAFSDREVKTDIFIFMPPGTSASMKVRGWSPGEVGEWRAGVPFEVLPVEPRRQIEWLRSGQVDAIITRRNGMTKIGLSAFRGTEEFARLSLLVQSQKEKGGSAWHLVRRRPGKTREEFEDSLCRVRERASLYVRSATTMFDLSIEEVLMLASCAPDQVKGFVAL